MAQEGHFESLRPLICGLASRGVAPHVFTDRAFAARVEAAGGTFVDMLGRYPVEAADAESSHNPFRYVTFAAHYADDVLRDLADVKPSLVVHDHHAVIGRVVAERLDVPRVRVATGHNQNPGRLAALVETLPPVHVSDACQRAVEALRERYGLPDASPYAFAEGLSPFLNVSCEPAGWLTEAERQAFEPVAFLGCLSPGPEPGAKPRLPWAAAELKLYVSLGTVVWRYWPAECLAATQEIVAALGAMPKVGAIVSLGAAAKGAESIRAAAGPNVSVVEYVDQWEVLGEADAFLTHHGLRSTHEAIFNRVPMVSYPVFWDQPALAERSRQLGLAVPLTDAVRGRPRPGDLQAALSELAERQEAVAASLEAARDWELEAIDGRDAVVARLVDLI
jgi:MGT family glycosyltransferase